MSDILSHQIADLPLFDDFPTPLWRSGADAGRDFFNRTWLKFTGLGLEPVAGDGWAASVHPDDVDRCVRSYLTAFHARESLQLEYRLRRPDGTYSWVVDCGKPSEGPDGQFAGYIGSCYDITDRKRAEVALRESEARFQTFMDNSPAMVIIKDAEGRYVYFNKTTERLVHATLEELRGQTSFDRLPYQTARQLRKNDLEVLATGQATEFIEPVPTPDGQTHYWLTSKFPVQDAAGQRMIGVIAFDITERKQVEESLRESEERFAKVFHSSPVTIGITTVAEGRFVEVNDSLLRLYGYRREEVIGRTATELQMWVNQGDRIEILQKLLEHRTLHDVEHTMRLKSGELRDGITSLELIELQGEPCILALTRDITEQKQAEAERARLFEQVRIGHEQLRNLSRRQLEIQETERRHLAHELHDEIGQALTSVQINLQTLQYLPAALPLTSRLEESIGLVDRALQQVRELSLDLRPSLLDDFGLVTALRWYVERQAQRAGFTAHFVADSPETPLPSHLEIACFRVAQEALTNVARHARAHHVHVELRRCGAELQLLVHDDGAGFDVRAAQGAAVGGVSLGLLGMQERVHLTGGRIEIESAPTWGTGIRACFPLQEARPRGGRTKRRRLS